MKTLKSLFLTFALSTTALTTYATEPTIAQQKQVAGYYHHQIGNTQIPPYSMVQTTLIHLRLKA